MHEALVVYASRHGATEGIADRIGQVLNAHGIDATVASAARQPDPAQFDAVLIGSGVYMGSWLKEGTEYLERYAATLKERPTWLFSSGPVPDPTKEQPATDDRYRGALGPAEGPGSGGRKRIELLADLVGARDHRVFNGAYDPNDPPKVLAERLARMVPAVKNILPAGDFREWDAIESWAREIGAAITREVEAKVPVA